MGFEELTEFEIFYSSFRLSFVIISLIIGIKIFSKYFSYKKRELFTVGLAWIFLSSAWWGGAFSFLMFVLTNGAYSFGEFLYLFLGNIFIAIGLLMWIYSFCALAYPHLKKSVFSVYAILCITYEVIIIYLLLTNISMVGSLEDRFSSNHSNFVLFFLVFSILSFLITGILFSKKSIRSEDPLIRWKGKFLLIAFVTFAIGAVFDTNLLEIQIIWVLGSIILIFSAIMYYLGFLLPDRIAERLNK